MTAELMLRLVPNGIVLLLGLVLIGRGLVIARSKGPGPARMSGGAVFAVGSVALTAAAFVGDASFGELTDAWRLGGVVRLVEALLGLAFVISLVSLCAGARSRSETSPVPEE